MFEGLNLEASAGDALTARRDTRTAFFFPGAVSRDPCLVESGQSVSVSRLRRATVDSSNSRIDPPSICNWEIVGCRRHTEFASRLVRIHKEAHRSPASQQAS
jgi:hypothetical protein